MSIKNMITLNAEGEVEDVNPLIRLACVNLIRKGLTKKTVTVGHETKYVQDPVLVIEEALNILNVASKTGQIERLREYFEND